jgi:hypothetical protein
MNKSTKVKLLDHEKRLLEQGLLTNITHQNANAIWLYAP